MSRIGKAPVSIPDGVEVKIDGQTITVKGKLGELTQELVPEVTMKEEDGIITLDRATENGLNIAKHGLYRALIANMVHGVSEGFEKRLELVGVGYRAQHQGQRLDLSLGFSHNIIIELPEEISVDTHMEKGKNPLVILKSHDKQLLGMVAAKIRGFRTPEPYKGKGVRYVGEYVRSKAGKAASK